MKILILQANEIKRVSLIILCLMFISGMTACQSVSPSKASDNNVCIGDVVVDDPDQEVDLEEMAREVECP